MKTNVESLRNLVLFGLAFLSAIALVGTFSANEVLAQTRSALVQDVENPARSPLRLKATLTVPSDYVGSFGIPIGSTLAADRRFVIEYVSFDCGRQGAIDPARVLLTIAEKAGEGEYYFHNYPIPLTKTIADWNGHVSSIGVLSPRWYHDGGQAVQGGIVLTGAAPTGGLSCQVEVSGYTVSFP
jgi:hypothetical protein